MILTGQWEARGERCPAEFYWGRHTVVHSKKLNYGYVAMKIFQQQPPPPLPNPLAHSLPYTPLPSPSPSPSRSPSSIRFSLSPPSPSPTPYTEPIQI